jgi:AraC family transcriptional regulator of arabinose operon
MDQPVEKGSGFEGQHHVVLPARVIALASREKPLLKSLMAAGAGYFPKAGGHLRRRPQGIDQAILIHTLK